MSIERPALYIVATPLGNLGDLSPRAIAVLSEVDLVLCEDTRVSKRLFSAAGIHTRAKALHDHNEAQYAGRLIADMNDARSAYALISDAGTPLISDPGYRIVRAAHAAGVPVRVIPGPCAPIAALSAAGLPTDRFCFEGFLPPKASARKERLRALVHETRTVILLESCHRIEDCLADIVALFGADREISIAREMTKVHEQTVTGSAGRVYAMLKEGAIAQRGEFVLVIAGGEIARQDALARNLLSVLVRHVPVKVASRAVAEATSMSANELYAIAQGLKDVIDE